MKSTVALVPCGSYDEEEVYEKIRAGLALLGGLETFVRPEEKVLLKLNLVRDAAPERAVTTHPAVAAAMARALHEAGFPDVAAGDSPGFGSGMKIMEHLGLAEPFRKYGVRMAPFAEGIRIENPDGIHTKSFVLARDVTEADAVISISKMKTHALEHLTGAVKNQYGCVFGKNKAVGHTKYPSAESMARMIVDLDLLVRPRLYLMDGITAMEGNGPTSGDPVHMGVLLFSTDPVALDAVFARLVGADPAIIPTETAGAQMGLGTMWEDEIRILTPEGEITAREAFEQYGRPGFRMIRERGRSEGLMGAVTKLRVFQRKPHIDASRCVRCGVCVESCPVEGKALAFAKGRANPPVYNYRKCIRCFCCQEMCPHKAIFVK